MLSPMGIWPLISVGKNPAVKILVSPYFLALLEADFCPASVPLDFGRTFCAKRNSRASMATSTLIFQEKS